MTGIILSGCNGKMGKAVTKSVADAEGIEIVGGVDIYAENLSGYPVFSSPAGISDDITKKADVIIDFSNPSALAGLLEYAVKNSIPAVISTTGLNDAQINLIKDAAQKIPVFFSANMSLGVNLVCELAKKAAAVLGDSFDIEIIEMHHNQKIDAPSGTALMIADSIKEELDESVKYEYDRHSKREKRTKNEIGIHAVRGGTITGEHQVIFAGLDEIITISHSARSKELFATGAITAAKFICGKPAGLYKMSDMI
ncbi:MAG: 4-hydroxy-tetrahydrodipicolinate reductase [Acutalibacteraceae bacterium]|nr:4-hydroxy-tetrahydrodipicolinate reductase [Acutalibacteraceae bacterium]